MFAPLATEHALKWSTFLALDMTMRILSEIEQYVHEAKTLSESDYKVTGQCGMVVYDEFKYGTEFYARVEVDRSKVVLMIPTGFAYPRMKEYDDTRAILVEPSSGMQFTGQYVKWLGDSFVYVCFEYGVNAAVHCGAVIRAAYSQRVAAQCAISADMSTDDGADYY